MKLTRLPILKMICMGTLLFSALSQNLQAKPHAKVHEQPLDNIVAVVNDNVITQTELNQATHIASSQLAADNMAAPSITTLRKQILEQLINKKLQLEAAELSGIQVEDAEIDKVVSHIAQDNHLSMKEFYERIAHEGLSSTAYRKQIRESLILQHLQQHEVASHITVSPEEINDTLRTASLETAGEKEYQIQDILIPVSDSPSPQEIAIAKKFAEDITARLRKGVALNRLDPAEAKSLQDNDLGWRKLTEVPTAFTAPVTHMKVNTYSNPIQTSNGFHIIHLAGLRSLNAHAPKPQKQAIAQAIFQRKFEDAMQGWIAKIRSQAFIEIYDKALT